MSDRVRTLISEDARQTLVQPPDPSRDHRVQVMAPRSTGHFWVALALIGNPVFAPKSFSRQMMLPTQLWRHFGRRGKIGDGSEKGDHFGSQKVAAGSQKGDHLKA